MGRRGGNGPAVGRDGPAGRLTGWWQQFNDPTLTSLVDEALKANLNLALAEASLRQARALRGVAAGGLWPSVTASGSYQREHTAGITPGNGPQNLYQAGLDAAWELDIFGGVRRSGRIGKREHRGRLSKTSGTCR